MGSTPSATRRELGEERFEIGVTGRFGERPANLRLLGLAVLREDPGLAIELHSPLGDEEPIGVVRCGTVDPIPCPGDHIGAVNREPSLVEPGEQTLRVP